MHIYNGKYQYLFDQHNISNNISYKILLDMNLNKYIYLFRGILQDIYSMQFTFYPLDMSNRLLYLYILDNCDAKIFKDDINEFIHFLNTNNQPIIAYIPYHMDILCRYCDDSAQKKAYEFNTILLDLFIRTNSKCFFRYINKLHQYKYTLVYREFYYDNLHTLIPICFNKLNDEYSLQNLFIINSLLHDAWQPLSINEHLSDDLCDKIFKDIRYNKIWNDVQDMIVINKYPWHKYKDIINKRTTELEAEQALLKLASIT